MKLSPDSFMHPKDKAAFHQLEIMSDLPKLMSKLMSWGWEDYHYRLNMASAIRLSEKQLPEIYRHLPPICEKLCIPEPEIYLSMNPVPNAWTFGDTRIYITLTSGLIEYMTEEELDAVIAHECGHILCRHVLYNSVVLFLKLGADMAGLLGLFSKPVQYAIFYWQRMSELSADRVAALVTSPDIVSASMARLAGGPISITENINYDEWVRQADEYERISNDNLGSKFTTLCLNLENNHPFSAVRVKEIRNWCASNEFQILKRRLDSPMLNMYTCPGCGAEIDETWAFCRYCGHKL